MAVCWSNYKTSFVDSGMDFNLSQQDIAKYYSLYFDLMNFGNQNMQKIYLTLIMKILSMILKIILKKF